MRSQIDSLGIAGPLLILALALIHAVVFYPAEIVDAAAGFAYGFFPALAPDDDRLDALGAALLLRSGARWRAPCSTAGSAPSASSGSRRWIERGGATLLIAVRLIPIFPFSLICYAAGAARVPLWRYPWTTAVGYLPITAIAVYFGTRLDLLSGLF